MNELALRPGPGETPEAIQRELERARYRLIESARAVRKDLSFLNGAAAFVKKHPVGCAVGAFAVGALLGALWERRQPEER